MHGKTPGLHICFYRCALLRLAFAGLRDIMLLVWPVFMIPRVWKKSVEEKLGEVCNPANNKPVQPKGCRY